MAIGMKNQTSNNDSPATMSKSPAQKIIAKLENSTAGIDADAAASTPALFAPFVADASAKPVTFQSIQRRRSRRKRPSRKSSNRQGKAECQKRSLSEQLQLIINRLNPTETNANSGEGATDEYNELINSTKSHLKTSHVPAAAHGADADDDNVTDAAAAASPEEAEPAIDARAEEMRNAATKIQSLARRCKAQHQYQTRKRIQQIQVQLDDMPNKIQQDRDELRQFFKSKKEELLKRMQASVADMRCKPADNSATIIAYLRRNNAQLRNLQSELKKGIVALRAEHAALKRENDVIRNCFTEVEEVAKNLMKENKSLKATEKKFRTQLRRKYKQQLWRQELHLRSEETQNALYKKCLGRIVHHVTRHEAIANRKPRRASDQPIVFELSDLVSAQPNRTTPIAPRDDDSRRMSDRSSSSSIYEYDSCTDESDDE